MQSVVTSTFKSIVTDAMETSIDDALPSANENRRSPWAARQEGWPRGPRDEVGFYAHSKRSLPGRVLVEAVDTFVDCNGKIYANLGRSRVHLNTHKHFHTVGGFIVNISYYYTFNNNYARHYRLSIRAFGSSLLRICCGVCV